MVPQKRLLSTTDGIRDGYHRQKMLCLLGLTYSLSLFESRQTLPLQTCTVPRVRNVCVRSGEQAQHGHILLLGWELPRGMH